MCGYRGKVSKTEHATTRNQFLFQFRLRCSIPLKQVLGNLGKVIEKFVRSSLRCHAATRLITICYRYMAGVSVFFVQGRQNVKLKSNISIRTRLPLVFISSYFLRITMDVSLPRMHFLQFTFRCTFIADVYVCVCARAYTDTDIHMSTN